MTPMPPMSNDPLGTEAKVLVGLSLDPPRHSRWSVLIRAILALPLLVVAEIIGIGAAFVVFVAWFAALFSGRVPDGLQRFLTNALRLVANLLAYCYLLVPRWPGVNFHSRSTEQVSVEVDHVRLRRWSVFFRILLGYPANIVNVLFTLGSLPFLVLMWCWGVVAGREPRSFHQALALVLRFQLRLQAYGCLLTPTQPFRGIFGDGAARNARDAPIDASNDGAPALTNNSNPARLPTSWFVERATRFVLVVILVIGAPVYALNFYLERPLLTRFQAVVSRTIVTSSYDTTENAMIEFQASVARCDPARYVGCANKAATAARDQLAPALATMSENALFPPKAVNRARVYESEFTTLESELFTVQYANSASAQRVVISQEIPNTYAKFGVAYHRLLASLRD
jgi:hypothetical protein